VKGHHNGNVVFGHNWPVNWPIFTKLCIVTAMTVKSHEFLTLKIQNESVKNAETDEPWWIYMNTCINVSPHKMCLGYVK